MDIYDPAVRRRVKYIVRQEFLRLEDSRNHDYASFLLKITDMHLLRWHRAIMMSETAQLQDITQDKVLALLNAYIDALDLPETLKFKVRDSPEQLNANKDKLLADAQLLWEKEFGVKTDSEEGRKRIKDTIAAWNHSSLQDKIPQKLRVLSSEILTH